MGNEPFPMTKRIEAYWLSPKSEIFPVEKTHIQAVAENPERYGTTLETVKREFEKYNEVFPFQEHKARGNILRIMIKNGWIRLRLNLRSATWTAETWEWGQRENEALQTWKNIMEKEGGKILVKYFSASKVGLC